MAAGSLRASAPGEFGSLRLASADIVFGDSAVQDLDTLAIGDVVVQCWIEVVTAFNAASTNVLTLGVAGTVDKYLAAADVTEGTPGGVPDRRQGSVRRRDGGVDPQREVRADRDGGHHWRRPGVRADRVRPRVMYDRRRYRWRGPQPARCEEQIANAPDDLFALSPASGAAAATTTANWAATLPSSVPFIWERTRERRSCEEDDRPVAEDV